MFLCCCSAAKAYHQRLTRTAPLVYTPSARCSIIEQDKLPENDPDALLHRLRVRKHLSKEIPKEWAVQLLSVLLHARRWKDLHNFAESYAYARNVRALEDSKEDTFVIFQGQNLAKELRRRDESKYYATALSADVVRSVLVQTLSAGMSGGSCSEEALNRAFAFYGMLPKDLLLKPQLLSLICLPAWSCRALLSDDLSSESLDAFTRKQMPLFDETLHRNQHGCDLLRYIAHHIENPKSKKTLAQFQHEDDDDLPIEDAHARISSFLLASYDYAKGFDDVSTQNGLLLYVALVHFLSVHPAEGWRKSWDLIQKIEQRTANESASGPIWDTCRLIITRHAACSDSLHEALELCNKYFAATHWMTDWYFLTTLSVVTARLRIAGQHQALEIASRAEANQFKIRPESPRSFTFSECFQKLEETHRPSDDLLDLLIGQHLSSSISAEICLEILGSTKIALSERDVCKIAEVFVYNGASKDFRLVIHSLRYFAPVRDTDGTLVDFLQSWASLTACRVFDPIPKNPSIESVATLMDHALALCEIDVAFDLFYQYCAPSFRTTEPGPSSCSALPKNFKAFGTMLAVCIKSDMIPFARRVFIAFVLDIIPSMQCTGSIYGTSDTADTLAPRSCLQSLFRYLNVHLSEKECVKMRHFLERLDLRPDEHQCTMDGAPIEPSKLYELSICRFPRSLLQ